MTRRSTRWLGVGGLALAILMSVSAAVDYNAAGLVELGRRLAIAMAELEG